MHQNSPKIQQYHTTSVAKVTKDRANKENSTIALIICQVNPEQTNPASSNNIYIEMY